MGTGRAVPQQDQVVEGSIYPLETPLRQHVLYHVRIGLRIEEVVDFRTHFLPEALVTGQEQRSIDRRYVTAMFLKRRPESLHPVRPQKSASPGQCPEFIILVRQVMGLPLLNDLDAMLHRAKEPVRFRQPRMVVCTDKACILQSSERLQGVLLAEDRIFSRVHQLQSLYEKFDLSNPAPAQLDVALPFHSPGKGRIDLLFHRHHVFDQVVVQVLPVNERLQHRQQVLPKLQRTGYRACFQHGGPFPRLAPVFIVGFRRPDRNGQFAAFPFRAEPQIDAKNEPVSRNLG